MRTKEEKRNDELRAEFQELIDLAREYENILKEHKDDQIRRAEQRRR